MPTVAIVDLLQAAADRGHALRVEAEPVHAPDVAGVLDLDAPVHDHRQAARYVGRMHWLGFNTQRITSVRGGVQ